MADNYRVGYKQPPRHSRFRPGQSGNAKGRPKGTKNLKTDLEEELREKIQVREGDQPLKLSKQRAILKAQANRAIQGDTKAANLVVKLINDILLEDEDNEHESVLTEDDQAILERYRARAVEPTEIAGSSEVPDKADE